MIKIVRWGSTLMAKMKMKVLMKRVAKEKVIWLRITTDRSTVKVLKKCKCSGRRPLDGKQLSLVALISEQVTTKMKRGLARTRQVNKKYFYRHQRNSLAENPNSTFS